MPDEGLESVTIALSDMTTEGFPELAKMYSLKLLES